MTRVKNLIGKKFSELTVIERAEDYIEPSGRHRPQWLCKCSCGGTIILKSRQLQKGSVKQCDNCNPKKRRKVGKHNLVGQRFGKWTVLELAENNKSKSGHTRWLCRCDCGTERIVDGGHLVGKFSVSCGCSRKEKLMYKDLKGKKFGRWTVLEYKGSDKNKNALWKCRCECGTEKIIRAHTLLSGNTLSCGCLKSERTKERNFKSLIGKRFGKLLVIQQIEDHIYPDGSKRTKYKCLCDCGNTVEVLSCSLQNGSTSSCGCITSVGEMKIADLLRKNNIPFKKQMSYPDLLSDKGHRLRFDFYIKNSNYLIEFDGEYHFKCSNRIWCTENHVNKTKYHDKLKNEYCLKNNIPLIRIPYTHNNLCIDDLKIETTKFLIH